LRLTRRQIHTQRHDFGVRGRPESLTAATEEDNFMSGDRQTGANQLATLIAMQKKGLGFSPDPADYQPTWIKLSGREFNDADPHYRPELDPDADFLVGDVAVGAEGVSVIILGMLSGHEEKNRVIIDGREEKRHFAFWERQPKVTPVKGKGGGLKTARGGWLTGQFDEILRSSSSSTASCAS
jgi:hypothetical protein